MSLTVESNTVTRLVLDLDVKVESEILAHQKPQMQFPMHKICIREVNKAEIVASIALSSAGIHHARG